MNPQSDLERPLPATPWKLQKAREKGAVWKSPDWVSACVFFAAVAYLSLSGWDAVKTHFAFDRELFLRVAALQLTPESAGRLFGDLAAAAGAVLLPFFGLIALTALVANWVQSGFLFSSKPLVPDWTRLNPMAGFKRFFTLRVVFDTFRAVLKLVVLCAVMYWLLADQVPRLPEWAHLPTAGFLHRLIEAIAAAGFLMALGLALVAVPDLVFSRREFLKNMRMSHRELRDEIKHREGDPRIRARLRELRLEWLKRSKSLSATAQADVLITNPTHLAVALSYRHGEMDAPRVLAKGAGKLAESMRALAARRGIPVVQNRTLARALWRRAQVEGYVPHSLYGDLAQIMIWVISMRQARQHEAR